MKGNIYFSVIIATHNRPDLVGRAIDSVLQQQCTNYEIILVNDGSTVPYDEVLEKHQKHLTYIKNETSLGVSGARNRGIAVANGNWLIFLDDDDEFKAGYFSQLNHYLNTTRPDVNFVWCNLEIVNYKNDKITSTYTWKFNKKSDRKIYETSARIGASYGFTVEKSALQLAGGFNESFKVGEDTELIIKLLASGSIPGLVPTVGVIKHQHNDNRLSQTYHPYSDHRIYETIFALYPSFLLNNPGIFLQMIEWSTKVHHKAGNIHLADKHIVFLKEIFRKKPIHVSWLYALIKILKYQTKVFSKLQQS